MNDLFEPLDDSPAYRRIAHAIQTKIIGRQLRTGDALPSESDLARQFGVNRSTVREAIRELETQGLLGRARGAKRLRVTRPAAERISSDVSRALALHDIGFLELWEAMMVIEPAAAEYAAVRRTAHDLDAIGAAAERFAAAPRETEQSVVAVVDFFRSVADASGNRVLAISQATLNLLLAPALTRVIDRVPQARDRIRAAQKSILAAVKNRRRDDARKWMEKHIRDFKRGYEVGGIPLEVAALRASISSRRLNL